MAPPIEEQTNVPRTPKNGYFDGIFVGIEEMRLFSKGTTIEELHNFGKLPRETEKEFIAIKKSKEIANA